MHYMLYHWFTWLWQATDDACKCWQRFWVGSYLTAVAVPGMCRPLAEIPSLDYFNNVEVLYIHIYIYIYVYIYMYIYIHRKYANLDRAKLFSSRDDKAITSISLRNTSKIIEDVAPSMQDHICHNGDVKLCCHIDSAITNSYSQIYDNRICISQHSNTKDIPQPVFMEKLRGVCCGLFVISYNRIPLYHSKFPTTELTKFNFKV